MNQEDYTVEEQVQITKKKAAEDHDYKLKCILCKEKVIFIEADKAYVEGHIYSEAGRREYGITQICEFCFDGACKEFEETDEDEDLLL